MRDVRCANPAKPGRARVEKVSEATLHCKAVGGKLTDSRRFLSCQLFDLLGELARLLLQLGALLFEQLLSLRRQLVQHAGFLFAGQVDNDDL